MPEPNKAQADPNTESLVAVIMKYITAHPGIHFNELHRVLNLAPGTLQYHLNRLEHNGKIIVLRMEYKTMYFPPGVSNPLDQKIMVLLRQELPRKLILHLLEKKERSGKELLELLKVTKSTLSYYTKRLEKLEVLKITISGREKRYSVTRPERIAQLITDYKKSFGDKMVDRFVELWVRI
jgi:predicted transcriptional regulator